MQCVTLVRHRVRKEVTILSITLFSEAEQWCLALRDAMSEDIGNGVKIVDFSKYNGKKLARADRTWTSNILFCRERTNTLFEAVMDELKTGNTMDGEKDGGKVLVTGAPGIGKSAMLYRVMREAFQEKRTVVFDRRQQREALIFLPKNSSYECWRYKSPTGAVDGDLHALRDPETFLLVDPSGKARGFEPPVTPAATLITASSNPAHYQQFIKNPYCRRMYMANWTPDELLAVRKHISTTLSEEDVYQRFDEVGGIVRHVFTKDFTDVLTTQEKRVQELSLGLLIDQDLAKASLERLGVSNYVFTYDVDVTKPSVAPPICFTSFRVRNLVQRRCEQAGQANIAARIEGKWLSGTSGGDFEVHALDALAKGGSFPIRLVHGEQQEQQEEQLHLPRDAEWNPEATEEIIIGLLEKSAASTPQQRAVFARCPKGFAVADMVTSSGQLLNPTINTRHSINCPKLADILKASGITDTTMSPRKLDIYFCLPPKRYGNFKLTWSKGEGFEWVKQRVRVYALRIPLSE
jgi:hypothetical protein